MSKIKTRETVRNVKVLDKAAVASENMKKAFIRTKDQTQNLADDGQVSSTEYASDQMQYAAEDITQEVGHVATSGIQKAGSKGREAYQHHKAKLAEKAEAASDPATAPKTKAAEQAKAKYPLIKSPLPKFFKICYNNTIQSMVVQKNETANIYRCRIQLPQEENEAGRISGNHGRDHPLG